MTCSLRYTWLDLYDGEPVINSTEGKEEEDEEDATCPVQVEQRERASSSETQSCSEGTQPERGDEVLVCERRANEYIYMMYEAALRKEIRREKMRGDTYTWQVRSKCSGTKECVARMTCLYKNNGAVSCVGGNVLGLLPAHSFPPAPWSTARCTQHCDTMGLHGINRNCNTFFQN